MPTGSKIVSTFLSAYESREPPFPELELSLTTYDDLSRHKYYRIDCQVKISEDGPDPAIEFRWRTQRRLCSLREELHDLVKALIGDVKYKSHFHPDARFASHGGFVPGTVGKLKGWLARLADIINHGKVPPKVTETVLAYWTKPSFTPEEIAGLPFTPWAEQDSDRRLDPEESGTSRPSVSLRAAGSSNEKDLAPLPVFATSQDDRPGPYKVEQESIVNTVADYTSALAQEVTRLKVGTIVNVLEVMRRDDLKRVRARIAEPEGWISLLDTSDGYRWAKRHLDLSAGPPPPSSFGASEQGA